MRSLIFVALFLIFMMGAVRSKTVMGARASSVSSGTLPGGTLPAPTATTGGTLPIPTATVDGTIPPTATPVGTQTAMPTDATGGTIPTATPSAMATPTSGPGSTTPTPPATATLQPIDQALTLSITADRSLPAPGGQIIFNLLVTNKTDKAVANVVIDASVPHYTAYRVGSSSPGWLQGDDQGLQHLTTVGALAAPGDPCFDLSSPGTVCTNVIPQIPAGGDAELDFGLALDLYIPISVRHIELKVSVNGQALTGELNQTGIIAIDPTTRLILPLIAQNALLK